MWWLFFDDFVRLLDNFILLLHLSKQVAWRKNRLKLLILCKLSSSSMLFLGWIRALFFFIYWTLCGRCLASSKWAQGNNIVRQASGERREDKMSKLVVDGCYWSGMESKLSLPLPLLLLLLFLPLFLKLLSVICVETIHQTEWYTFLLVESIFAIIYTKDFQDTLE